MANYMFLVVLFALLVTVNSKWGGSRKDDTPKISAINKTTDLYEDDYDDDDYEDTIASKYAPKGSSKLSDTCVPAPLGGVDWVLSVRQRDFGWKEDTHRAVIVLAVTGWGRASSEDIRLMKHQLEVELTKAYVKNSTAPMYPNDLALYIHALIAIGRNPRNFFGIDWASDLDRRMTSYRNVHPFLLLALCNADRMSDQHVHQAAALLQRAKATNDIETLAHALNAYECMGSRGNRVDESLINDVRSKLIDLQHKDGSFGNVYTTSLVVQALSSADWDNSLALTFLKQSSTIDVNMVSTYYIQLALNADKYRFIKDLYPSDKEMAPAVFRNKEEDPFIQYTIRNGRHADVYFTINIRVPSNSSFFDVMKLSAQQDSKFNFSYHAGQDGKPVVYSISDTPNDIEDEMSWKLCLQTDVNHDRHQYKMRTVQGSPAAFFPKKDQHVLYWYRRTNCENS